MTAWWRASRLSDATPTTLSEAVGPVLEIGNRETRQVKLGADQPAKVSDPPATHWIAPIYYGTTYSVLCGS
jgi:hypothetical protein